MPSSNQNRNGEESNSLKCRSRSRSWSFGCWFGLGLLGGVWELVCATLFSSWVHSVGWGARYSARTGLGVGLVVGLSGRGPFEERSCWGARLLRHTLVEAHNDFGALLSDQGRLLKHSNTFYKVCWTFENWTWLCSWDRTSAVWRSSGANFNFEA